MASQLDYAALSASVYNHARGPTNKLSAADWKIIREEHNPGFSAVAYQNTEHPNDIVISIKGSDAIELTEAAFEDWILTDLTAGLGFGSAQIGSAALFYERVKSAMPGADISFTGHSLGGGLAAIMAVYFNRSAVTFDAAPFGLSEINPVVTAAVAALLLANGIVDGDFAGYAANPLAILDRRNLVRDIYVQGEFLQGYRNPVTAIYGVDGDAPIVIGGGSAVSAFELHSINLAAALALSEVFRKETIALPKLLKEVLDDSLYARDLRRNKPDFLTLLLKDQINLGYSNPRGLLASFALDLSNLKAGFALSSNVLNEGLLSLVIEDYYGMQSGFTKSFFSSVQGGVEFSLRDIASPGVGRTRFLAALTSLDPSYASMPTLFQSLDHWVVSSDYFGLTYAASATPTGVLGSDFSDIITGSSGGDALIGNGGADSIDGAAGDDFIDGGVGDDQLDGGAGSNVLIGGAGDDTYVVNLLTGVAQDRIVDVDRNGHIVDIDADGRHAVQGVFRKTGANHWTSVNDGGDVLAQADVTTLTFTNGSTLAFGSDPGDFASGSYGIVLVDSPDAAAVATTGTITAFSYTLGGYVGTEANELFEGSGPHGTSTTFVDGQGGDDAIFATNRADLAAVMLQTTHQQMRPERSHRFTYRRGALYHHSASSRKAAHSLIETKHP